MGFAGVHAGGEGIQPADAVGKTQVHQEIQRPIGDRGLIAKTFSGKTLQHVIGAHGLVRFQQDFQRAPPDRGQPRPLGGGQRLGPCQHIGGATAVVMAPEGGRRFGAARAVVGGGRRHRGLLTCYDITYIAGATEYGRARSMRYIISFLLTSTAAFAEVPSVVTDIPPVHSLTAAVMQGLGEPVLLMEKGASAHHYQLKPSQAGEIAAADLVVWVGPQMTPWLDRALETRAEGAALVSLLAAEGTWRQDFGAVGAVKADAGTAGHDHDHADGQGTGQAPALAGAGHADHAEAAHTHDGVDPHAWLDPANGKVWAGLIAAELTRLDPENAAIYAANAAAAVAAIDAADAEAAALLAPVKDRPFVAFHDAYGYFVGHYGLALAGTVALGDAAAPGAQRLSELRGKVEGGDVTCLFPEAQHDPALVEQLAEGTGVAVGGNLDPAGAFMDPGPGLYPALLVGLASTIAACGE